MSTHSYSRIWIHAIWETLAREPMLDKRAAAKASVHLADYAVEKRIYMKINYFNSDHTHALIDLPTSMCIEEMIQLFKGSSSHWINENRLMKGRFAWAEATEHFLFLTQMLIELPGISPARKNITGKRLSLKSTSFSSSGMA
ncbi:MAG: transposase [Acidobacteriota bacterium]|nr:transposase [Acidobacteriota bacterium]